MTGTAAQFRTARCAACGMIYYGNSAHNATGQHDLTEGHELTAPRINGDWTAGVFVAVADAATGAAITDVNEVARVLGIHCNLDDYTFEIEAEWIERGHWLVTLPADDYATASEEGGFEFEVAGLRFDIPMH
jgi:hypothetical protein